jgi:hypothetical protein
LASSLLIIIYQGRSFKGFGLTSISCISVWLITILIR